MEGSFPLKLVRGFPAVIHGRTLIVADLHIGIEREFWRLGIRASGLSRQVKELLGKLLERTRPKRIVVAGDLKHNIPDFTRREAEEVQNIAEFLASQGEFLLVKGNHDGDIERIIPWAEIVPGAGFLTEGIYIMHGHARPHADIERARTVVLGHIHPAYAIKHKFGKQVEKVFLLGDWHGIPTVVLPAFSPLITGMDVSRGENLIGPIAREIEGLSAFLMDGTYVGRIPEPI